MTFPIGTYLVIQVIHTKYITTTTGRFPPIGPLVPPEVSAVLPSGSAPDLRRSRLEKLLTKQDRKNHTFTFFGRKFSGFKWLWNRFFFGIKYYVYVYNIVY